MYASCTFYSVELYSKKQYQVSFSYNYNYKLQSKMSKSNDGLHVAFSLM